MKKLLALGLALLVSTAGAVIISYEEVALTDDTYTGWVTKVTYDDGSVLEGDVTTTEALLKVAEPVSFPIRTAGSVHLDISGTTDVVHIKAAGVTLFTGIFADDLDEFIDGHYAVTPDYYVTGVSDAVDELVAAYEFSDYSDLSFDIGKSGTSASLSGHIASVPEPMTMGLFGLGLVGLAFWRKRRS